MITPKKNTLKIPLLSALLTICLQAKAQSTIAPKDSVLKQPSPTIIRSVDLSKMSPNERDLVLFMDPERCRGL